MAELHFVNEFSDLEGDKKKNDHEFVGIYRQPSLTSTETLFKAAMDLKNEVIQNTWGDRSKQCRDPTIYTGLAGTAFLCLKTFKMTGNLDDLELCSEIIDSCASLARHTKQQITFLCGKAGIYALGAVAADCKGDSPKKDHYLNQFKEILEEEALSVGPDEGGFGMPYELLQGRSGFLWAALFLNKHLGEGTIGWNSLEPIVEAVLAGGRAGACGILCPLMYRWHGTRYWGAAHGLAGIMFVLLHFPLSKEDASDVKGTLTYMIKNRFPYSGNYPSSEGNSRDRLVQWCHGASGVAMSLCKAAQVFPAEKVFREAAIEASEVVWKRGLLRKLGLCHGISGNAYTFLSLYRLTNDAKYLNKAKAFTDFLYKNGRSLVASGNMHGGDHPYSLYEGLAGTACLWLDISRPGESSFPGYEL